jgi:hypothetical protein
MVCDIDTPMEKYFGPEVGAMILDMHLKNGVKVLFSKNI